MTSSIWKRFLLGGINSSQPKWASKFRSAICYNWNRIRLCSGIFVMTFIHLKRNGFEWGKLLTTKMSFKIWICNPLQSKQDPFLFWNMCNDFIYFKKVSFGWGNTSQLKWTSKFVSAICYNLNRIHPCFGISVGRSNPFKKKSICVR